MNIIPLNMMREGATVLLKRITGSSEMQSRLASLGLTPGTALTVISRNQAGSFVVSVNQGRLALGREMARCLWVA